MPIVGLILSKFESVTLTDYQGVKLVTVKRTLANGKELNLRHSPSHNGRMIVASDIGLCQQILRRHVGNAAKKLSSTETYKNCGPDRQRASRGVPRRRGPEISLCRDGKARCPTRPTRSTTVFVLAGLNKSIAVAWSLRMNGTAFRIAHGDLSKGEREGLLGTLG